MESVNESKQPAEAKRGFRFSWVSLLVFIAILGVIAAVVIPSYGDYTHRAQNSEAISLLATAKPPLSEYFRENGKWPESLARLGASTSGKFTKSVEITKGAGSAGAIELTATMRTEGVDRRVAGMTILMISSDGGKNWTCKPGTMPAKHLPADCRAS